MIFKQYYLGCLSHASYLIGDEESHIAAIVDPQRDIDEYLKDAAANNLRIQFVLLTHFHADFVAGHLELRDRTGAEICLGARAQADFPFRAMIHGYEVEFGSVRLEVLETPGHTPESICLLVYDLKDFRDQPHAVLTGDTLFVGDVGRPDLMASRGYSAQELAGELYDSLHHTLLPLPDDIMVYPAHGAGSLCGRILSPDTSSTLGVQKQGNYALQPMNKEQFVELVTTRQPEAPRYFSYDASLNRRERPTLDQIIQRSLKPLMLDQVLRWKNSQAQMVDVRHANDFAGGHLAGSLNVGLGGRFETWAGILLDVENPIVIIAPPGMEREAVIRLGRIGFDHVVGYLKEGIQALASTPQLVQKVSQLTAQDLNTRLMAPDGPCILDVRTAEEWTQRKIDGSLNIPLNHLTERLQEIPRNRAVVVHCASGYRSSIAASLLELHGFSNIEDLQGGFDAWEEAVVNPSLYSAEPFQQIGG